MLTRKKYVDNLSTMQPPELDLGTLSSTQSSPLPSLSVNSKAGCRSKQNQHHFVPQNPSGLPTAEQLWSTHRCTALTWQQVAWVCCKNFPSPQPMETSEQRSLFRLVAITTSTITITTTIVNIKPGWLCVRHQQGKWGGAGLQAIISPFSIFGCNRQFR